MPLPSGPGWIISQMHEQFSTNYNFQKNSALTPTSPVHRPSCYGERRSTRRPGPGAAGASGLACHLAIRRSGLRSPAPARHHATPAALGFGFITKSRGASSVVRLAGKKIIRLEANDYGCHHQHRTCTTVQVQGWHADVMYTKACMTCAG
jgi:hypothetical protein